MSSTILLITASARGEGSISRKMAEHFQQAWRSKAPTTTVITRDIGSHPPPFISEAWIGAAFTPAEQRDQHQRKLLASSDEMIDEVDRADLIVIASPMYNYGMPAALKAWFDQVIRVNKTFSFDLGRGDWPLEPIFRGKRLVLLSSKGEFGFQPGGSRHHMNHLDTHIATVAHYLGVNDKHFVSIEYQEFGDERHERSKQSAHQQIDDLVQSLTKLSRDQATYESAPA
ncbi:NAD(P)H-dependent oxidoreductase [Gammaproteobacteria bacterium AB-CW1]|uniref:FMN dependent NADH:quinone oxidoreductase n=1 Tax=Natronospira elongata TaxID=3110268 RepID=A0AAP6MN46_9GAMM|nr:NAD(P)H-dependent oxidoreductase [Gammaproteobacteria bacterium AB-CW1]